MRSYSKNAIYNVVIGSQKLIEILALLAQNFNFYTTHVFRFLSQLTPLLFYVLMCSKMIFLTSIISNSIWFTFIPLLLNVVTYFKNTLKSLIINAHMYVPRSVTNRAP